MFRFGLVPNITLETDFTIDKSLLSFVIEDTDGITTDCTYSNYFTQKFATGINLKYMEQTTQSCDSGKFSTLSTEVGNLVPYLSGTPTKESLAVISLVFF